LEIGKIKEPGNETPFSISVQRHPLPFLVYFQARLPTSVAFFGNHWNPLTNSKAEFQARENGELVVRHAFCGKKINVQNNIFGFPIHLAPAYLSHS
jgi:hypothetical protein